MRRLAFAAIVATMAYGPADAALYTSDFGDVVAGYTPNDDSIYSVSLPFAFTYFGSTYTTAIVSNNGNVQFGTASNSWTSSPLNISTTLRGIAPFWSDLDSRGDGAGSAVHYSTPTANQAIFTWDRLGYFSQNYSSRVQFQLVLNNPDAPIASDEAEIGFYYGQMGGMSNKSVSIGFGDGQTDVNSGEISVFSGNSVQGADFVNSGPGQYRFNVQGGVITQAPAVPEPVTWAMMLLGFGGVGHILRRRKQGVRIRFA